MARLGIKQVNHREAVARLRARPGQWLPVGEYRSRSSAKVVVRAIHTGQWPDGNPSAYTAGEYEATTELTELGVRVLARYLGSKEQTTARFEATVLGGHTAVVWAHGHSSCIALTHIDPITEEVAA